MYPRALGDDSSIDWTDIITTGEQVVGQVITGNPVATRYPTYTPVTTAVGSSLSTLLPVVVIGAAVLALSRRR